MYQEFKNVAKSEITCELINSFLDLAKEDERVESIELLYFDEQTGESLFQVATEFGEAGKYSMGRIAGFLHETPVEIEQKLKIQNEPIPDIINLEKVGFHQDYWDHLNYSMPTLSKNRLIKHALSLKPSVERAQCINIANYRFNSGESIAGKLLLDHRNNKGFAFRSALLMVDARCANLINRTTRFDGNIVFEDGSKL